MIIIRISLQLASYEKKIKQRAVLLHVNYKAKVAKVMFIVVITFMICKIPFTALIFYRNQLLKNDAISSANQVQNQVISVKLKFSVDNLNNTNI